MRAMENKTRQRLLVEEVQGKGQIERAGEFIAEDFVDHTPFPGVASGLEGAIQIFSMLRQAFPDHDAVVEQIVAEGDLVATYKTFNGTHEGEFMGVPPTGRRVCIRVMDFVRYRDGKIAEHWNVVDVAGLMHQLGASG